jgi:transaldolase/glucose-6-phosphate isomerase
MATEPHVCSLVRLHENFGQSPWLDSIDRELISSGGLHDRVAHHGLRGVTSNPSIFERAMTRSDAYDAQLELLLAGGDRDVKSLYEELAIPDIQAAADILGAVHEGSGHRDGLVSLEVAPALARDTQRTIDEARRLWKRLDRPNVMIKVPGTDEGIPAIRRLIADGVSVNITLLFSRATYRRVVEVYLEGLEERLAAGLPIDRIASVASFFVSRIDSVVDKKLAEIGETGLQGKIAIDNAKLAYSIYREVISSDRWKKLEAAGAHPQRLLWASTSTKNPAYRDVLYVEELIGRDTVDTMPTATMRDFEEHGVMRESLLEDLGGAGQRLARLSELGISLDEITDRLTDEGIRLFSESFDGLMSSLERRKRRSARDPINPIALRMPVKELTWVGESIRDWSRGGKIRRLWGGDSTLWTGQDESRWLGWLNTVEDSPALLEELRRHRSEGETQNVHEIVLLGMGGSSLAPEVFQMTFDSNGNRMHLHVLDSTDPAQISRLVNTVDPVRAFFIVSSKSGTTLEPNVFLDFFHDKVGMALGEDAGKRFIAITDPGSQLERLARELKFSTVFHGNPAIGGRYSALSAFGIVPAAMMGVDVERLLESAERMVHSCGENVPPDENPGVILGAALGALGKNGRDKVTILCSPEIGDFGAWIEQLLAESTGKLGKGLIPVSGEKVGSPESYGDDRLFVYLRLRGTHFSELDQEIASLEAFGHPLVRIEVKDTYALGQEFFRWEMATAVAGAILGINPFDQPDVESSKIETRKLTEEIERTGNLPEEKPALEDGRIRVFVDEINGRELRARMAPGRQSLAGYLRAHFDRIHPHDYFAILAYLDRSPRNEEILAEIREMLRSDRRVATCLGFGPRFLHSTGQAYKGGPDTGVFLQITSDHERDLRIPGHAYSFGQVEAAQARGDLEVLVARGRRCLRVHLPADQASGLEELREAVRLALRGREIEGVAA